MQKVPTHKKPHVLPPPDGRTPPSASSANTTDHLQTLSVTGNRRSSFISGNPRSSSAVFHQVRFFFIFHQVRFWFHLFEHQKMGMTAKVWRWLFAAIETWDWGLLFGMWKQVKLPLHFGLRFDSLRDFICLKNEFFVASQTCKEGFVGGGSIFICSLNKVLNYIIICLMPD